MTKETLSQYADLLLEADEVKERIKKLERQIEKAEKVISQIEKEGTVFDSVSGGYGGTQHFKIEGFPNEKYTHEKSRWQMKRLLLEQDKIILEQLEDDIHYQTKEIDCFIKSIRDSYMRRIINLRFINRQSWKCVAQKIGGGNSEDTVRKAFERFLQKM